jgi:hypothetical protein
MSDMYDADILAWSEHQAALLRRVAAGERINNADLDWPNIIDEVETVGRNELHAVESLLVQALLHVLKAKAWPLSAAVSGWQKEVRVFKMQVRRRFVPSMAQKIDLADLYLEALLSLPEAIDGQPPLPVPSVCPVTLDELLSEP